MNIFFLDEDHIECAKQHIDAHVSKMSCEYAQLLSTCHRVVDGELWIGKTQNGRNIKRYFLEDGHRNHTLYKACHINHPCNIWLRESQDNYLWLYKLWIALGAEFEYRYNKVYKSIEQLQDVLCFAPDKLESKGFTEPPPAMKQFPQCIVEGDSVQSYKNYYWEAKRPFAKWTKREKPAWWVEREEKENPLVLNNESGIILE